MERLNFSLNSAFIWCLAIHRREDRHLDGEVVELDAVEVLDVDLRLGVQHLVLHVDLGEALQDRVLEACAAPCRR